MVPPGHPCRFPFFLFIIFILRFFLYFLSFSVFPFFASFSFVLSFVLSFSVCFLYRLRFYFRLSALLGGSGFCYSVISSRRYTPPRAPCEPEVCVFPLRAVFFLSCVADVGLSSYFSSLPSLFRFRFGHLLFSTCLFLVGTMLSLIHI